MAKYTVGVDDVDTEAATELGILVCHAPTEDNCFGVAETTMVMMLAILKKVRERDAAVRAGRWREPALATHLRRQPAVGRLCGHHRSASSGWAASARGSRNCWRRGGCGILAYDPYVEPAQFLLAGAHRGRLRDAPARVRRGVLPRRADQGDALHAVGPASSPDEAQRGRHQHRARQGGGRGRARPRASRGGSPAPRSTRSRRSRCRPTRRCARSATRC